MALLTSPLHVPHRWNHGSAIEPAWLFRTLAESDAVYYATIVLASLVVAAGITAFFWATSVSTHK
jgi:hypothetical protein